MKHYHPIRHALYGFAVFALCLCGVASAKVVAERWVSPTNGTSNDSDTPYAIAKDSSGNLYVCGSEMNSDTGNDFHVVKYDALTGVQLWKATKRGNGTSSSYVSDLANSIAVGPDGFVYAAGDVVGHALSNNFTDMYLVKLDPANGSVVWERSWGSTGLDRTYAMAVDSESNIVLTGYLQTPPATTTILKLNSSGDLLWTTKIEDQIGGGNEFNLNVQRVEIDGEDNVIIGGTASFWGLSYEQYVAKINGDTGTRLWEWHGGSNVSSNGSGWGGLTVDSSNNIIYNGITYGGSPTSGGTNYDFMVVKINGVNGAETWRSIYDYGVGGNELRGTVAVAPNGDVYAIGSSQETYDPNFGTGYYQMFTSKLDGLTGSTEWLKRYPHELESFGKGVAVASNGDAIALGQGGQGRIVRYTAADGTVAWDTSYAGPSGTINTIHTLDCLVVGPSDTVGVTLMAAGDWATLMYHEISLATLDNLQLSAGNISPSFDSEIVSYTLSVPSDTTSTTVAATLTDPSATMTVNGVPVASEGESPPILLPVGETVITVEVTAEGGATSKTYTIAVSRAASPVATLSSLLLSAGTITPAFDFGTSSYSLSVANAVTDTTVTPTTMDAGATVKVNGITVASGSPSPSIDLAVGPNEILVEVTAQDGVTTQTYTVTITRSPSSVATLSGLSLSAGSISPTFASGTVAYTLAVTNAVTGTTVTPTTTAAGATVKINGTTAASGSPSPSIALAVGSNSISVEVTAQDQVTTKTYTVTITRAASNVTTLSGLSLSAGSISPVFASGTVAYTLAVANAVTTTTVTPTTTHAHATVKVKGTTVASGSASASIVLAVGPNAIPVEVTAQDGVTKRTYTITVTRAASQIATLKALALSAGALNPAFQPNTLNYTLTVSNAVDSTTVTPRLSDSNARVKVNGTLATSGQPGASLPLLVGSNTIKVEVVAQNGTTKLLYKIIVTRKPSSNAWLNKLTVKNNTLSPVFAQKRLGYKVIVPASQQSIRITASAAHPKAKIKIAGKKVASGVLSTPIDLNPTQTTIKVVVTAEDGSSKIYKITATRP